MDEQKKRLIDTFMRNWVWRTAHCLFEVHRDVVTVANIMKVNVESINEAADGLFTLGFIEKNEDGYRTTNTGILSLNENDWLKIQSTLSPLISSKMKSNDKFANWFFRADRSLVAEYSKKFAKLYEDMIKDGESRGCTEVFASEIRFAKIAGGDQ